MVGMDIMICRYVILYMFESNKCTCHYTCKPINKYGQIINELTCKSPYTMSICYQLAIDTRQLVMPYLSYLPMVTLPVKVQHILLV